MDLADHVHRSRGSPPCVHSSFPRPQTTTRQAGNTATLDFAAMNAIAAETGRPVVGPPMTAEEAAAIVERER